MVSIGPALRPLAFAAVLCCEVSEREASGAAVRPQHQSEMPVVAVKTARSWLADLPTWGLVALALRGRWRASSIGVTPLPAGESLGWADGLAL